MRIQRNKILTLLLLALATSPAAAVASQSEVDSQLKLIIADIEYGWENADGTPFYLHFLGQDGARYVETGGQNEGLDDLVEHHVVPEGDV